MEAGADRCCPDRKLRDSHAIIASTATRGKRVAAPRTDAPPQRINSQQTIGPTPIFPVAESVRSGRPALRPPPLVRLQLEPWTVGRVAWVARSNRSRTCARPPPNAPRWRGTRSSLVPPRRLRRTALGTVRQGERARGQSRSSSTRTRWRRRCLSSRSPEREGQGKACAAQSCVGLRE